MTRRVSAALARLEPPPRLVDWSILALVAFELASGLYSFTVGRPSGAVVFWLHNVAGVTLVGLLLFKFRRVAGRVRHVNRWDRATPLSIATATVAIATLATGVAWVLGANPDLPLWTLLNVHIGLGFLLGALVVGHMWTRFRVPSRGDLQDRRVVVQYTALLVGGVLAHRLVEAAAKLLAAGGAARRFTGSKLVDEAGNAAFPVTSWVADDPDPVDRSEWALSVDGAVREPLELDYEAIAGPAGVGGARRPALLDCTSGWYTVQSWQGVRVGDLLDRVGVTPEARYVRFVSVTGYRWSLPIEEAREALVATHVGDEPLSHGHGAPLRLVAPGRRGFQWVKWIERVEVRRRGDPAQWVVTLVSGFE
jgi:DMSO/TMAO reductase YedYZ molybdopterin-dependent catalytic subunit